MGRPLGGCLTLQALRSASIRLMTLSGRSSGSTALTGLPAALRLTNVFSAFSYLVLEFRGIEMRGLAVKDMAREIDHVFRIRGFLMSSKYSASSRTS